MGVIEFASEMGLLLRGLWDKIEIQVLLPIIVVLALMRWRRVGMFTWALAWWLALYIGLRFGFTVPVPSSVITLYMGIVTVALLAYVSSSRERWRGFSQPILKLILEPQMRFLLLAVCVLLPLLAAWSVYARLSVPLEAPAFGRTVHPSPPTEITVHDSKIDLVRAENPALHLRQEAPEEYAEHVENGRRVYYQNCFYCHGDGLAGNGMFAHALNPIPTNFMDPGVLPNFQESFFFWRASKGGPGLPEEGGPWDTAMPAWENLLTEEEIWDAVRFLFEFSGYQPRALAEHGEEATE